MCNFRSLVHFQGGRCSGTFELQILEIENLRGEVAGGECCGSGSRLRVSRGGGSGTSSADKEDTSTACTIACRTFFKVCLKEYQNNMSATSVSCSYGNTSSPVLGANSFTLADPDRANGKLVIRFKFSWTVSVLKPIAFYYSVLRRRAKQLTNFLVDQKKELIFSSSYVFLP